MKRLFFSLSAILLAGCVEVPMTTITVPTANGIVKISAPKDTDITGLKANFEKGTVTLDSYKARMNPDIISASAVGQMELIKAYGELANTMGQLGMRAFAASQGMQLPVAQSTSPAATPPATITTDQLNALIQRRAEEIANARATNQPAEPRHVRRPASTNAPPVR